MPALYFPACAFIIQIVLSVVFFSRSQKVKRNNQYFAAMLILGLLDSLLISIVMILLYLDFNRFVELGGWINKVDFMLYIMWVTYFMFYICTIPTRKNAWFIKHRSDLMTTTIAINVIIWIIILIAPIEGHSINNLTFYETGLSTEIPLIVCTFYMLLVLIRTVSLKESLTKKYIPVPVVLGLLGLTAIIRTFIPGIAIIPFVAAVANMIILLTFENPDARLLEIEKRNRDSLKKIDAAKDDFISMASHQLRTPLTSIKGYIAMLIDGDFGKLTSDQKRILSEAYISSERMVFIINDFLDVSRLQTGKFEIQKMPVRLNEILESEVTQLKVTARARKIQLLYTPPANLPVIECDQNKLRQVMMNLIDNAIFYSHTDGKIEISLYQKGKRIIFTVRDHGIGVPKIEQRRLFEKFFRASNARQVRPDGTGVGLYMARKIIIAHGGSLIFESQENVGSTFGFRLPIG
jgi:signal transduction histidine kinase